MLTALRRAEDVPKIGTSSSSLQAPHLPCNQLVATDLAVLAIWGLALLGTT